MFKFPLFYLHLIIRIDCKTMKETTTDYREYMKIPRSERDKKISQAKQSQIHSKPHPLGNHQFPEIGFMNFYVQKGSSKIRLQTYRYSPSASDYQTPKGLIFMFHGLNNYVGRGAHIASFLSRKGFVVVGFDHRGFGRSEGKGGYIPSLKQHLQDSRAFIDQILFMQNYKKLPRFILGQSMGGLTAYSLALKQPNLFDGVIMMAPALKNQISQFKVNLTKAVSYILPKKLVLPIPEGSSSGTRNPEVTKGNRTDNFVFRGWVNIWTLEVLVRAMEQAPSTFSQFSAPFLVIQGGMDKVVNCQGAIQLYQNACTKQEDKQILFYSQMWHNVWHEEEIFDILQRMMAWIQNRVDKCQSNNKFPKQQRQNEEEQSMINVKK